MGTPFTNFKSVFAESILAYVPCLDSLFCVVMKCQLFDLRISFKLALSIASISKLIGIGALPSSEILTLNLDK